ncbi:MAG: alpha/beta hydrolase [Calothrix sp. MO_167.B12]|nr:alpha/beta hydrolase [Calothrix sp. MO_167.B12]
MLTFQPPGFKQCTLDTTFGQMVYSIPDAEFWQIPLEAKSSPLVFLHSLGGGSSAYEWSKVYPAFAATHQVIAPDLIGWGDSAHPARNYQPQDYLNLIQTLLEEVAVEPAWVVASSLTAGLTIRLAIQQPQLFQGLFLVSPSGYGDFGADYGKELVSQVVRIPGIDRIIYGLGAANELAVRNFLQQFLFAKVSRLDDEIVAAYLASAVKPNAEYAALSSLKGDICFDLAEYMKELQVPTVFLWGEKSRFSSSEKGRRLSRLNPDVIQGFHEIPGAGVLPHLEIPAIVTGLLSRYLSKIRV